jgi:hypothetical protein
VSRKENKISRIEEKKCLKNKVSYLVRKFLASYLCNLRIFCKTQVFTLTYQLQDYEEADGHSGGEDDP